MHEQNSPQEEFYRQKQENLSRRESERNNLNVKKTQIHKQYLLKETIQLDYLLYDKYATLSLVHHWSANVTQHQQMSDSKMLNWAQSKLMAGFFPLYAPDYYTDSKRFLTMFL